MEPFKFRTISVASLKNIQNTETIHLKAPNIDHGSRRSSMVVTDFLLSKMSLICGVSKTGKGILDHPYYAPDSKGGTVFNGLEHLEELYGSLG